MRGRTERRRGGRPIPIPDDVPEGPLREYLEWLATLHKRAGWPALRELEEVLDCAHTTVRRLFLGYPANVDLAYGLMRHLATSSLRGAPGSQEAWDELLDTMDELLDAAQPEGGTREGALRSPLPGRVAVAPGESRSDGSTIQSEAGRIERASYAFTIARSLDGANLLAYGRDSQALLKRLFGRRPRTFSASYEDIAREPLAMDGHFAPSDRECFLLHLSGSHDRFSNVCFTHERFQFWADVPEVRGSKISFVDLVGHIPACRELILLMDDCSLPESVIGEAWDEAFPVHSLREGRRLLISTLLEGDQLLRELSRLCIGITDEPRFEDLGGVALMLEAVTRLHERDRDLVYFRHQLAEGLG